MCTLMLAWYFFQHTLPGIFIVFQIARAISSVIAYHEAKGKPSVRMGRKAMGPVSQGKGSPGYRMVWSHD